MTQRDIVVVGASAGGIEAIRKILRDLPADLPASLFIVVHIAPDSPGYLAEIFDRASALRVWNARDGDAFVRGSGYVAPADHHLILESSGRIRLTRGPRENRTRPAVDPLFRSAALAFGPRVIGVVLTGGLDDGSAGLRGIKMCGGTTIVQDPNDADVDSMPLHALRNATVDYCEPISRLGSLINDLVRTDAPDQPSRLEEKRMRKQLELEVEVAKGNNPPAVTELGEPSIFTCPECHGTLMKVRGDRPRRYRCHTGHAFTAETLLAEVTEATEEALWNTIRSMQEASMLMTHMAEHSRSAEPHLAEQLLKRATTERLKADRLRQIAADHEILSEESVGAVPER